MIVFSVLSTVRWDLNGKWILLVIFYYWNDYEINTRMQPQLLEFFHHHKASGIETLQGTNIEYILPNEILKLSEFPFCFDYRLGSFEYALHQMIPLIVLKVILYIDNHVLHDFQRGNTSIFLQNYMLHMGSNVLNWIKIEGICKVLIVLHLRLLFDKNIYLLMRRCIVFHDN